MGWGGGAGSVTGDGSVTRSGSVTGAGSVTRASTVTRAGSGHPLGQQCPSFLQRVLPPCHPRGRARQPPHPAALRRPAAMPRDEVTAAPVTLTPAAHLTGAPGVWSTQRWPRTGPPLPGEHPGPSCPLCPCCPVRVPGTARLEATGSTGHPSSLPGGSTPCREREGGRGGWWLSPRCPHAPCLASPMCHLL